MTEEAARFWCPRREGIMAYEEEHIEDRSKPDHWRTNNTLKERACSYCGSMHPDDFFKFLDRVLDENEPSCVIDLADLRHKVYARRPEVKNGNNGPIKFYFYHCRLEEWFGPDKPEHKEKDAKIARAIRASARKFAARDGR